MKIMKITLVFGIVCLLLNCNSKQTTQNDLTLTECSNYVGDDITQLIVAPHKIKNRKYDSLYEAVLRAATGVGSNDIVFSQCRSFGAFSSVHKTIRYILYNKPFFDSICSISKSNRAAQSVIAHELAHLIQNHPTRKTPNFKAFELEADYYSGYLMRQMQVSLEETLFAITKYGNDKDTRTHPAKSTRIAMIKKGWIDSSVKIFDQMSAAYDSSIFLEIRQDMLRFSDSTEITQFESDFSSYNKFRRRIENKFKEHNMANVVPTASPMMLEDFNNLLNSMQAKLSINQFTKPTSNVYIVYGQSLVERDGGKLLNDAGEVAGSVTVATADSLYVKIIKLDRREFFVKQNGAIVTRWPNNETVNVGNQLIN